MAGGKCLKYTGRCDINFSPFMVQDIIFSVHRNSETSKLANELFLYQWLQETSIGMVIGRCVGFVVDVTVTGTRVLSRVSHLARAPALLLILISIRRQ